MRGSPTTSQMDLWRISPNGGEPERLTQHNSEVSSPAPLDLRTVVYVARDRDGSGPWLWALDVNRKTTHRISFGLEKYVSVAASADGRHLVATEAEPDPELVECADPESSGGRAGCKAVPGGHRESLGPALRRNLTVLFILSRHRRRAVALPGRTDHGDLERLRWSAARSSGRFRGRTARGDRASPRWEIDAAPGHGGGQ